MTASKLRKKDEGQSSHSDCKTITMVNCPSIEKILGRLSDGMNHNQIVLPKILNQLMKAEDLSLRKLSKKLGIPQSTLSNYLSGTRKTYEPNILAKLAHHFNVSIEFLLFGEMKINETKGVKSRPIFSKIVRLTLEDVFYDESLIKGNKNE